MVTPGPQVAAKSQPAVPRLAAKVKNRTGFASREKWIEHFKKHGSEVGAVNAESYLEMAQLLRDAPLSGDIREATRASDRRICRFQFSTGLFLVYERSGTIATFFRPNDGVRYFERQLKR